MGRKIAKYKVTLTEEERRELEGLISAGKSAARNLGRARILLKADAATLQREVAARENDRNRRTAKVNRRFTTADARVKLRRLYPSIE
jgi:hypothetical protein